MDHQSKRINVLELRSVHGTGGGPEKTILLGAARADTTRINVVVCYIRDARDKVFGLDKWARELGVNYIEVPEAHSFDRAVLGRLKAIVREHQIDIVHAHEYKTDLLAWLLARQTGITPLATAHGWTGQSPRERFVYYPFDKWILGRLPKTIAVSSDIRRQLLKFGAKPDRVTVILNAIDATRFTRRPDRTQAVRESLGAGADDLVIGAVGRVERQKRFDLLLDAMPAVLQAIPRARLVIVGDGSLLDSLRSQANALRISDRVTFAGHRTDISDLHNGFDLFVQSSDYEGTPNAVLEAMAMETPLVATAAGGTEELFTSGVEGVLIPCGDVPALTTAIVGALSEPEASARRAAAARRRTETELSFEVRTRRLEAIYEELARA